MKSPKYDLVKNYYESGLWNKKAVKNAVVQGWITAEEYEEIVGEVYVPDETPSIREKAKAFDILMGDEDEHN